MTAARVERHALGGVSVLLPGVRLVSEANEHTHYSERAKRASSQRMVVAAVLRSARRVAVPCVVAITRIAPRDLDTDNLQGSAKHVRDEVAAWLGVDDRDPRVTWHVGQERGAYSVRVEVVPASPAATVEQRGVMTAVDLRMSADDIAGLARGETVTVGTVRLRVRRTDGP